MKRYPAHFQRKQFALFVLVLLAGLATLAAGCDRQQELKETGPSAKLNNDDLVKLAVATMKSYTSYHMEFHGGVPSENVQMSPNMTITGDLQFGEKGSSIKMSDDGNIEGAPALMLGMGPVGIQVRDTKDGWYESYDGGKTWDKAVTDTPGGFLMLMFGWWWNEQSSGMEGVDPYPSMGENMVKGLAFKDGSPRVEEIGGVVTRHIVAGFAGTSNAQEALLTSDWGEGWSQSAKEVDLWVTTDISPTIRQMRIEGSNPVAKNEVGPANALAFSPDGHLLAVAHGHAGDWTVRLWDLGKPANPAEIDRKLRSEEGPFGSVAFSPDGKWLAAGVESSGAPSYVYLWDVTALDAQPTRLSVAGSAKSVAFGGGGGLLAVGTSNGVYLWEAPFKDAKPTILAGSEGALVNVVTFSKDGLRLAAGTLNSGVLVYDLSQSQSQPESSPTILPHRWVNGLAFSPDGQLLASAGDPQMNNGDAVDLWDLTRSRPAPVILKRDKVGAHMSVAFSPDGKWLATINRDGNPALWETARLLQGDDGEESASLPVPQGEDAGGISFNPDGQLLAAISGNSVLIWEVGSAGAVGTVVPSPTVVKEDEQIADSPYTLTWQWSRFGEDFGEVKAPLAESIRNP